jgi:CRISPR-associated endoribonuclease Cas6
VIIPEIKYIYQSLMNKYSAASKEEFEMFDSDTLEQLTDCSEIAQYRLKSTCFPVEGIRIPSFKGEICLRMRGTDTMARYARFLLRFGEYSGVGIKSAMGMGAIKLKERRGKDD